MQNPQRQASAKLGFEQRTFLDDSVKNMQRVNREHECTQELKRLQLEPF